MLSTVLYRMVHWVGWWGLSGPVQQREACLGPMGLAGPGTVPPCGVVVPSTPAWAGLPGLHCPGRSPPLHPLLSVRYSQGISVHFLSGLYIEPPPTANESELEQKGCRKVDRKLGVPDPTGPRCSSWRTP